MHNNFTLELNNAPRYVLSQEKFMKFVLTAVLLASVSTFAAEPKQPFCDKSVSVAPGEDGDILAVREIQYKSDLPFEISRKAYAANKEFFKKLGHGCLQLDEIEVLNTGKRFLVYRTNKDECDGGNTFGIIVSEQLGKQVADIQDGNINCK